MKFNPFLIENLKIQDLISDGRGLARYEDRVIMVKNAVPEDVVNAWVYKKQKNYFEAEVQEIVSPSPKRIPAQCEHFGTCGGCKLQYLDYSAQLQFKQKQVEDAILRIGKLQPKTILPIQGSEKILFYRNKLEFSFSTFAWKNDKNAPDEYNALGFHVPNFWDKVVDIQKCWLQNDIINTIRNAVRNYAIENRLSFYNPREQHGFLRNLLFRTTAFTQQLMVGLILGDRNPTKQEKLVQYILNSFPEITTLVTIINSKKNDSYSDLTWETHKGEGYIYEQLEDKKFRISPLTFFQTNSLQALKLYQTIKSWIPRSVNTIYDLYAGCGSIGIFISDLAHQIIGIEYVPSAVVDAEYNLKINDLHHLKYFTGDISKILTSEFIQKHGKPEMIITDPPRAGMDEKVVKRLLEIEAESIIYVSCNPSTQARDLQILAEKYHLEIIQPFDMFPHTHHVENLALLKLK
ncbi:MAG: 23S rRNA (uracil-5-)-methyltransferase RumA [Bacteroidia bacterium]|nr:MAG: 23S rRNA (uracil-5-)-methyltransferase RumA [Bacteroidia bacterium]